jgi:hypothetical protein
MAALITGTHMTSGVPKEAAVGRGVALVSADSSLFDVTQHLSNAHKGQAPEQYRVILKVT